MNYYDAFLVLLTVTKVTLVVSAVLNRFHVYSKVTADVLVVTRTGFDVLMCLLLMFLFNPFYTKLHKINYETCVFIFVFAVLTLLHTLVELYPKK